MTRPGEPQANQHYISKRLLSLSAMYTQTGLRLFSAIFHDSSKLTLFSYMCFYSSSYYYYCFKYTTVTSLYSFPVVLLHTRNSFPSPRRPPPLPPFLTCSRGFSREQHKAKANRKKRDDRLLLGSRSV